MHQLTVEIDRMYLDVAQKMNDRVIGIFPTNRPATTGASFFTSGQTRRQELRQVYTFTSTASINHGINIVNTNQFTGYQGTWTDGTNSYGLIFGTSTAITGQISFYVTSTQIVFVVDGAAPTLSSGMIVLSWLSQP